MNLFHERLFQRIQTRIIMGRNLIGPFWSLDSIRARGIFLLLFISVFNSFAQNNVSPKLMLPFGTFQGWNKHGVFSPDNHLLMTFKYKSDEAQIWDVESGVLLLNVPGKIASVSEDRESFWTITGNKIKKWDFEKVALVDSIIIPCHEIKSAEICHDGKRALILTDTIVLLWDFEKKVLLDSIISVGNSYPTLEFSPDGSRAIVEYAREIIVLDVKSGKLICKIVEVN